MPVSSLRVVKDAPTRFDLYSIENHIERLADAISDQANSQDDTNTAVDKLTDEVEELRKSVDALTKAVEKLPELMPQGGE